MFGLFLTIYHQTILLQRMKLHCTWVVVISVSQATFWGYQRGNVAKKVDEMYFKYLFLNLKALQTYFLVQLLELCPCMNCTLLNNEIISKLRPYDFYSFVLQDRIFRNFQISNSHSKACISL